MLAQSIPADALRDEILLDLLLNLTFVFENDVDRARTTYDAALPENSGELSFDEAIAAGWVHIVWGRLSAPLPVAERARAVPGSNTALAALLAKRFGESFIFSDKARGDPKLNPYIAAIERGETLPRNLHCEDPVWVAARLWDRSLSDAVDPAAELRVWVDRWRLLGYPSIIPHRVWTEAAAAAFRETALGVLETESSLFGWEETRSELVQQMAVVSGQPPASAEPFTPKVPTTFVDRALWFSDLRLERAVLESLGTHDVLFGLARLLLADVEDEDHAPAPHKIAEQLFTLALDRAELFLMLLFRVRHNPILLADLVLYPPTSALACLLVAQWQSPGGAYERELRGRDDQVTKSMAFSDAVSVLGHFLEQGSIPPAEAASLLDFLHRSAKPGFIDDLEKSESMLATLRGELASQSPDVLRRMFEALASGMPQAGLGTSAFAAALDILDLGKLAGSIDATPLILVYIQSVAAGEYALSANRISFGGAASLVELALGAAPDVQQKFFAPIDIASRIAAASASDANPFAVNDEMARSIRTHARVLCRAIAGLPDSAPDELVNALIKAIQDGTRAPAAVERLRAFSVRYEAEPFRRPRDRPMAADLGAALSALVSEQRDRLLLAILQIDEPTVLAQLLNYAPHALRERIERRIAALTPADAGDITSLTEAQVRIEELLSAGQADAAERFIEIEPGLQTLGKVPGRETMRLRNDLRLRLLRRDWDGIAATQQPGELSGYAKDQTLEIANFYKGLAALLNPAGDREGAAHLFATLQARHPDVAAYAINLFATRIALLLGADFFAELKGRELVKGRQLLADAEQWMLHARRASSSDIQCFNGNKATLLLALGQPDQAHELLSSLSIDRLRDNAAAYAAIALARMARAPEALTALNQAEKTFGSTDILLAARAHIRDGRRYTATPSFSIEDDPIPRIKGALFDFRQLDQQRQAEIFRQTSDPFESLLTDHVRTAGGSVTSLVPMKTLKLDLWEDDTTSLFRALLAANIGYLDWTVHEQSRAGFSAAGNAGRPDLLLQKAGTTIAAIEAVRCKNLWQSTYDDLTKHFRKLLGYSGCALFFHLTFAFVEHPASILDYLKQTAERDAPNGFTYMGLEAIPHTDERPIGFIAHYRGSSGPIKVIFLILDMLRHAQSEAARTAGETYPN